MKFLKMILLVGILSAAPLRAAERPNIVFIITDDQPKDSIGVFGGPHPTPNLNRIATEGIRFARGYTTAPLCVPTRYSCLTGSWASRNTWRSENDQMRRVMNNTFMDQGAETVARSLKNAGYQTAFVGKDHSIADMDIDLVKLPPDADPADPEVVAALEANHARLADWIQSWGFDYVGGLTHGNLDRQYPKAFAYHNMEYILHGALEFLEERDADKPFFLWFATTLTHSPETDLETEDPRLTPLGYRDDHLGVMRSQEQLMADLRRERGDWAVRGMAAKVAQVDEAVGILLDRLDRMGLADNTLVVFMSDQDNDGKATLYESGIHTPMMARWPAVIESGRVTELLVDNTDLAPTWMEAADAAPPPGMVLDGHSLIPLFRGDETPLREAVFAEMGFAKSVTTGRWKYIAIRYPDSMVPEGFEPPQTGTVAEHIRRGTFDGFQHAKGPFGQSRHIGIVDPDQLYDLAGDPGETRNLAGDPAYAETLAAMKDLLADKIEQTGRPFGEFGKK